MKVRCDFHLVNGVFRPYRGLQFVAIYLKEWHMFVPFNLFHMDTFVYSMIGTLYTYICGFNRLFASKHNIVLPYLNLINQI